MTMEVIYFCPGCGALRIVSADGRRIDEAVWTDVQPSSLPAEGVLRRAVEWLDAYFAGRKLPPMPPLACDGTEWQRRVWRAIDAIPPGVTVSYGEIARSLGCRGAARAVGAAAHCNRVMVFRGCHRVVGARGELTGYAGGIERKRALLAHERSISSVGWKAL